MHFVGNPRISAPKKEFPEFPMGTGKDGIYEVVGKS